MASAHTLGLAVDRCLREGLWRAADPGASGTIAIDNKGLTFCDVVTAAAETRALPAAEGHGPGTRVIVNFITDGGNLTITGPAASVILDTAGDRAEFEVVQVGTAASTRVWKVVSTATGQRQRQTTSATSGTFEGIYTRLAFEGDGTATGEALRAFTNVNANIGTAHGAHLSLSFDATAGGSETSGLGAASRSTLHIPNVASWAPTGTYYAAMAEIYSDGSASDPAGMTELACLCLSNSGDSTGRADVDDDAFVLSIQGFTAATGVAHAISSTSPAEFDLTNAALGIRVKIGSGTYYVPAIPAADWN